VRESILFLDVTASFRDEHSKFKLMVDSVDLGDRKMELFWLVGYRRPRLQEYDRFFGDLGSSHLQHMLKIVFAYADYLGERFQSVALVHLLLWMGISYFGRYKRRIGICLICQN